MTAVAEQRAESGGAVIAVLGAISLCHFLNDSMQSVLIALYPVIKSSLDLSFSQIGLVTLSYQIVGSILQPLVGMVTDRRPQPYSLVAGMGSTLCGLLLLSVATGFPAVLAAAVLIGLGSSVFHPESSRIARLASGGRHGFAQSFFQVGGNIGQAAGPIIVALTILPFGQGAVRWCGLLAVLGMIILWRVGGWYAARHPSVPRKAKRVAISSVSPAKVGQAMIVLAALMFAKFFYIASLNSYYSFYLIERFHLSVRDAQIDLFVFMGSVATGTLAGGPIGDRIGRSHVIWVSILGILPFTLMLPYADLFWTVILTIPIGFILASAFPAIIVYAQELAPGRVGSIAGLFFGFAFGVAGVGAAVIGVLADHVGLTEVYRFCAFLPVLGLLAIFLPDAREHAPE